MSDDARIQEDEVYFIEDALRVQCTREAPLFKENGNYFQPATTLLFTIFLTGCVVGSRRLGKILQCLKQLLYSQDNFQLGVNTLVGRILYASQQPTETQEKIMVQLRELSSKEFCDEVFDDEDVDFVAAVDRYLIYWQNKFIDKISSYFGQFFNIFKYDLDDPTNDGNLFRIAEKHFINHNHYDKLDNAIKAFEDSKSSVNNLQERKTALVFFFLNFGLAFIVLLDYLKQEFPNGPLITCRIPYVISVICFKPFALPMWACLTVSSHYTFMELVFGKHPQGRDVTGTSISSPLPRNIITITIVTLITFLLGVWFVLAFVTYSFALIQYGIFVYVMIYSVPLFCLFMVMKVLDKIHVYALARVQALTVITVSKKRSSFIMSEHEQSLMEDNQEEGIELQNNQKRSVNFKSSSSKQLSNDNDDDHVDDDDDDVSEVNLNNDDSDNEKTKDFIPPLLSNNMKKTKALSFKEEKAISEKENEIKQEHANMKAKAENKKDINFKLTETIFILKIAASQLILTFILMLPLIQRNSEKIAFEDGLELIWNILVIDIPNISWNIKVNFGWPQFTIPRFQIQFAIGFTFLVLEHLLSFVLFLLNWLQEQPWFIMNRDVDVHHEMYFEPVIYRLLATISWYPFRNLLSASRTLFDSLQRDRDGDSTSTTQKFFLSAILALLSTILLLAGMGNLFYYCDSSIRDKEFGSEATEEEIRDFCNDEVCISYTTYEFSDVKKRVNITFLRSLIHATRMRFANCPGLHGETLVYNPNKLAILLLKTISDEMLGDIAAFQHMRQLQAFIIGEPCNLSGNIVAFQGMGDMEEMELFNTPTITGDITFTFEAMTRLKNLYFSNNPLLIGDIRVFRDHEELEVFHLAYNKQFTGDVKALEQSTKINTFHLEQCREVYGDVGVMQHFEKPEYIYFSCMSRLSGDLGSLKGKKSLKFIGIDNSPNIQVDLKDLGDLPQVYAFRFSCMPLISGDLLGVTKNSKIEELSFTECNITGDIEVLEKFPLLSKVRIDTSKFGGDIKNLKSEKLRSLCLKKLDTLFGDVGALQGQVPALNILEIDECHQISGSIEVFKELSQLFLAKCSQLSGELSIFEKFTQLRDMKLDTFSKISGDMISFKSMPKLHSLHLKHLPNIQGSIKALEFSDIKYLILEDCPQLTGDIEVLKTMKSLKVMEVDKCPQVTGDFATFEGTSLAKILIVDCPRIIGDIKVVASMPTLASFFLEDMPHITGNLECFKDLNELKTIKFAKCNNITGNVTAFKGKEDMYAVSFMECPQITGDLSFMKQLKLDKCCISMVPDTASLFQGLHLKTLLKKASISGSLTKLLLSNLPTLIGDIGFMDNMHFLIELTLEHCPKLAGDLDVLKKMNLIKEITLKNCPQLTGDIEVFVPLFKLTKLDLDQCDQFTGSNENLTILTQKFPDIKLQKHQPAVSF